MPLTMQKLQLRLRELRQAMEDPGQALAPVLSAPADGPMTSPPQADDARWQGLENGQTWGLPYGTCWLQATLPAYHFPAGQTPVLQLLWDRGTEDSLLRRLEATVFLDDRAIGAFDWRHPLLALPATSS